MRPVACGSKKLLPDPFQSPLAVRGSKEMLLYSRDHSVSEGLNYIATWNAGMMSQVDLQAGIAAQMSKSHAVYED